jgi:ER degradation enhancer, mannosidase alpha-like 1
MQCNIRLLRGLISPHLLAKDYISQLKDRLYHDQLLHFAVSLGNRLLPAFETPTGLPYFFLDKGKLY